MTEKNNAAWSLYRLRYAPHIRSLDVVYDPRCPWCTLRRSNGHAPDCNRPGVRS